KKYENPSLDNSGVLLHGLNLYYYLLLRDSQPNLTGIASKSLLKDFKEQVLDPLMKSTKTILKRFDEIQKEETKEEEITEEELKKYMEMETDEEEEMDEKEIEEEQQHTDKIKLTLWMVYDILQRIESVMKQMKTAK